MAQITADFRNSALRCGILVRSGSTKATPATLAVTYAAVVELANLGFLVNPKELEGLSTVALTEAIGAARKVMGADRNWTPIYPGFPKQVEELSSLTLLVEQILHYWTGGAFLPDYPTIAREGLPLEDMLRNARELKVLSASATARELIRQLATSPVALSEDDKVLLRGAMELQHPDLELIGSVAKAAGNGENMQTFVAQAAAVANYKVNELLPVVAPAASNLDQLLRVLLALGSTPAAAQWEANYKLAVGTLADRHARSIRMAKLSRGSRRLVVERVGVLSRDFKADALVGRQDLWRTAMRAIHPYDFTLSDEQKRAADIVHSNVEYRTLNSLVEAAMENGDVVQASELLAAHQPGNLLRRVVALLRLVQDKKGAKALAEAIRKSAVRSSVSTLISAYNGIIAANDDHARVTRVAGLTNTVLDRGATVQVKEKYLAIVSDAVKDALTEALKTKPAPKGAVAVVSEQAVPLVRRDAATADRVLDRGQELTPVGSGDVLRVFGHWNNNQKSNGYMDIGAVVLDEQFVAVGVSTWNSWEGARDWSTYSGDCNVAPGGSAAEFVDVKLTELRKRFPSAAWVAMTVQSWSGWPMAEVDFIAGAMLRSDGKKGEVFDARTVATAFKPTTSSTQSVPFAVNLKTGKMVWIDSSNGSTASGVSAVQDDSVGTLVYDEIARPRLTMGELAELYAAAHGAETVAEKVDRDQLLALLG